MASQPIGKLRWNGQIPRNTQHTKAELGRNRKSEQTDNEQEELISNQSRPPKRKAQEQMVSLETSKHLKKN